MNRLSPMKSLVLTLAATLLSLGTLVFSGCAPEATDQSGEQPPGESDPGETNGQSGGIPTDSAETGVEEATDLFMVFDASSPNGDAALRRFEGLYALDVSLEADRIVRQSGAYTLIEASGALARVSFDGRELWRQDAAPLADDDVVAADGVLVRSDGHGRLRAFALTDGSARWSTAVSPGGLVRVGTAATQLLVHSQAELLRLDALTGEIQQRVTVPDPLQPGRPSPPFVHEQRVYLSYSEGMRVFDRDSLDTIIDIKIRDLELLGINSSPTLFADGGSVYAVYPEGYVLHIDPTASADTGTDSASRSLRRLPGRADFVITSDELFVTVSYDGRIAAYAPGSNTEAWSRRLAAPVSQPPRRIGSRLILADDIDRLHMIRFSDGLVLDHLSLPEQVRWIAAAGPEELIAGLGSGQLVRIVVDASLPDSLSVPTGPLPVELQSRDLVFSIRSDDSGSYRFTATDGGQSGPRALMELYTSDGEMIGRNLDKESLSESFDVELELGTSYELLVRPINDQFIGEEVLLTVQSLQQR